MSPKVVYILIALVVLGAAVVFFRTAMRALVYAPEPKATTTPSSIPGTVPAATSTYPARFLVPKLGISAAVQYVGINPQGNMRAPSNFTDVSWYQYGAVPGSKGSAVMAGHVDNGLGLDGVFKHINSLAKGDDVYILRKDGVKLHFVVDDIETYPYQSVPLDTVFNRQDANYLNLITCEGGWVPSGRTYDHRLVIYTKLQPS